MRDLAVDDRLTRLSDDKVIAAWNGLMIGAFADAGRSLGEKSFVDIATEAQNQQLLAKLTRGQALQLQLQRTVEGLSIAAISYYVVSLVLYGGNPVYDLPFGQAFADAVGQGTVVWRLGTKSASDAAGEGDTAARTTIGGWVGHVDHGPGVHRS